MNVTVNGEAREVAASTLAAALEELGFGEGRVATAVNGDFVPKPQRARQELKPGDSIEVVAPKQGG